MKYYLTFSLIILNTINLFAQDWTILGTGVNDVAYDLDGSMWVAGNGGVYHQTASGWINYNAGNSPLRINIVNCVAVDASGNKWFGLQSHGLMKFDGTNWSQYDFIYSSSSSNSVYNIQPMGNTIWVSGYYLIGKFDGTTFNYKLLNSLYTSRAFIPDSLGNVWMRTSTGLCKFDGTNFTYYSDSSATTDALARDSQNNYWLYADSNLVKFDGVSFQHYSANYDHNQLTSVYADPNDDIWLGEINGKLHKFSSGVWSEYDTSNSLLSERGIIQPLINDPNGNLLVGNNNGGLLSFDGNSWTDISIPAWSNNIGLSSAITSAENSLGETWVSSSFYLSKIIGGVITNYSLRQLGFSNVSIIRKIYFDYNDVMWIATDKGVISFDGTSWNRLTGTDTYSVEDIIQNPVNGDLFFSASLGLLHYDGVAVVNYTNLYAADAYALTVMHYDIYNQLWIASSNRGLIKFVDPVFTFYNGLTSNIPYNIFDFAIDQNNIKCLVGGPLYKEFNDSTNQVIDSISLTPSSFKNVAIDLMNNRSHQTWE